MSLPPLLHCFMGINYVIFQIKKLEGEIVQALKANGMIVTSQKLIEYFTSHSPCKSLRLNYWRGKRFQQRQTTSVSLPRLGWGHRKWKCKRRPCPPRLLLTGICYLCPGRWELEVTSTVWECEWQLNIPC